MGEGGTKRTYKTGGQREQVTFVRMQPLAHVRSLGLVTCVLLEQRNLEQGMATSQAVYELVTTLCFFCLVSETGTLDLHKNAD